MDSFKIISAIHEEHKQRTGHDVTTHRNPELLSVQCDVCMNLHSLWKELEEEYNRSESEYYATLTGDTDAD